MLIACLLAAKSSVKADCYRDPHQNKLKCDNGATLFNLQQPAATSNHIKNENLKTSSDRASKSDSQIYFFYF
jgi:hypothetical protein